MQLLLKNRHGSNGLEKRDRRYGGFLGANVTRGWRFIGRAVRRWRRGVGFPSSTYGGDPEMAAAKTAAKPQIKLDLK